MILLKKNNDDLNRISVLWYPNFSYLFSFDNFLQIMNAVILLLLWKTYLAAGDGNIYKAYYNGNFITFIEKMNSISKKSMIWEIFNNL